MGFEQYSWPQHDHGFPDGHTMQWGPCDQPASVRSRRPDLVAFCYAQEARSPSSALLPTFLGEGSPTKIDHRKKRGKKKKHIGCPYSNLSNLEGLGGTLPKANRPLDLDPAWRPCFGLGPRKPACRVFFVFYSLIWAVSLVSLAFHLSFPGPNWATEQLLWVVAKSISHHFEAIAHHCLLVFTGELNHSRVSEGWCLRWISQPATVSPLDLCSHLCQGA